jgi:hypothetical protein
MFRYAFAAVVVVVVRCDFGGEGESWMRPGALPVRFAVVTSTELREVRALKKGRE